MKKKYLYNGQIISDTDVAEGAKQSNLDIDSYAKKAGMKAIDDNYSYNGKSVSAEDILDAANQSKLGFDDYIQKAGFTSLQKKNTLPNGSGNGTPKPVVGTSVSQTNQDSTPQFNFIDRAGNPVNQNFKDDPAGTAITKLQSKRDAIVDNHNKSDNTKVASKPNLVLNNGKFELQPNGQDEVSQLDNQISGIKRNAFTNPNQAKNYVSQKIVGKTAVKKGDIFSQPEVITPTTDISTLDLNSVKGNLDKNNTTDQLAFSKLKEGEDLNEALSNSSNLNEAAVKYAAAQNPQIQKQVDALAKNGDKLPDAYEGALVENFLNNPAVINKADNDPEFATQYKMTASNILNQYPSLAKKIVSQKIAQAREDRGMNNPFVNIPIQSSTDDLVNDLINEGKFTEQQKDVYNKQIRPSLGVLNSIGRGIGRFIPGVQAMVEESPIPTPGFAENFQNSYVSTLHGMAHSAEDVLSQMNNTNIDNRRLSQSLQDEYTAINLDPKSAWNYFGQSTGHMTGFVVPMIMGGAATKALGASPFSGELMTNYLMFEGQNKELSLKQFADNPTKQFLYTTLATAGDMMIGRLIPTKEAGQGVKNLLKDDIKTVINDFTDGKITAEAARNTLLENAKDFIPKVLKGNTHMGATMAGFGLFHNGLDLAFGGRDVTASDAANEAIQTFKSGFLGGTFISALAANTGGNPKLNGSVLREMASNPDHYKEIIENDAKLNPELESSKNGKIANLNDAAIINKDLEQTDLTDSQKNKYLIQALSQKVWERKAENATDDVIKADYLKKAKENLDKKQKIYDGLDQAPEYNTFTPQPKTDIPTDAKIESAVIQIGGNTYEGKNHAEAIQNAKAAGEDISNIDRKADGKFKLSDGTIIDRSEALNKFGSDQSEVLIPQDEAAKKADAEYQKTNNNTIGLSHGDWLDRNKDFFSEKDYKRLNEDLISDNPETKQKAVDEIVAKKKEVADIAPSKMDFTDAPLKVESAPVENNDVSTPIENKISDEDYVNTLDKYKGSSVPFQKPGPLQDMLERIIQTTKGFLTRTKLIRHTSEDIQASLQDGVYSPSRPLSFTRGWQGKNTFGKNRIYIIANEGVKHLNLGNMEMPDGSHNSEHESILSRDLKYKVIRTEKNEDGGINYHMEIIEPDVSTPIVKEGEVGNNRLKIKERNKIIQNHLLDNEGDIDGAFGKAGYVNLNGIWVAPEAVEYAKKVSPETWQKLKDGGIKYLEGGDDGRGLQKTISYDNKNIRGIGVNENVGDSHSGHDHTLLHELAHHVWQEELTPEQKKVFQDDNPVSNYAKSVKEGKEKTLAKHDEEDFAELYAKNGGDINKAIAEKKAQETLNPIVDKGSNVGEADLPKEYVGVDKFTEAGYELPSGLKDRGVTEFKHNGNDRFDLKLENGKILNDVLIHKSLKTETIDNKSILKDSDKTQISYGGKVKEVDTDFKQSAQRVRDNLAAGETGYVKLSDGKVYEISTANKTAKLLPSEPSKPSIVDNVGVDKQPIPEKIKNKFSQFKNIQDENITSKEQTVNGDGKNKFQVGEPQSERLSKMKEIVGDLIDEGITEIKDIQDVAARELNDNSPELKKLVSDAYDSASFNKSPELQTGLAKRINSFVSKIFGKKEDHISVLKNSDAMRKKSAAIQGDGKKVNFSINGNNVEGVTVGADVVNGFYSPIEKRINEFKQDRASATKWKEIVGSKEEAKWTGVNDWLSTLKPNEQVTKEQILQHMKDNRISIVEVVKGDIDVNKAQQKLDELNVEKQKVFEKAKVYTDKGQDAPQSIIEEATSIDDKIQKLEKWAIRGSQTKFGDYQLSGEKENYKEVLITMPSTRRSLTEAESKERTRLGLNGKLSDAENKRWKELNAIEIQPKTDFRSSHFDEPNILAHLRMNTRVDAEGKKVLFVEEVQSDWGQKGKREGFDIKSLEKERNTLNDERHLLERQENDNITRKKIRNTGDAQMDYDLSYKDEKLRYTIQDRKNAIDKRISEINKQTGITPEAPFVTDTNQWTKLGLKYALRHAVDEGATKVAWTTGEQQNERYDLSKSVGQITYNKNSVGLNEGEYYINVRGIHNEELVSKPMNLQEIEATVGKDIAEKISNDKQGMGSISGDNLKVGGKGMKGFYGEPSEGKVGIVGNVAKALVKELTGKEGKIGETKLNEEDFKYHVEYQRWEGDTFRVVNSDGKIIKETSTYKESKKIADDFGTQKVSSTQHSIEITPELKGAVERGQPLFQKNDKGEILGFTDPNTGKIYLNGEHLNPNTPIHEAGHIWTEWAKDQAPNLYKRGIDLINQSKYIRDVNANEFYKAEALKAGKEGSPAYNEYMQHEALAKAIGDNGEKFITEARKNSFKEWAKNLWNKIATAAGFKDVTADELRNMTLDEFSKRAATDILKGEPKNIDEKNSQLTDKQTPINNEGNVSAEQPPINEPPAEAEANQSDNLGDWTRVNLKSLTKVRELFRKVGISWDARSKAAMEGLQSRAREGETLVHTATREMDGFYNELNKGGKIRFNTEDQIAMHFLKISTEQESAKLAETAQNNEDYTSINSIGADVLSNQLDRVNAVLGAMRSESGVGLGYGTVEARLHPDYGLQVRQMQMIRANGGEPLSAELEGFVKDQWAKEKEIMQREQVLREQGMKEDFDKQIADLQKEHEAKIKDLSKNKPATEKEKTSNKLRDIAKSIRTSNEFDKFLKSSKGDIQAAGISINLKEAAANAVEHIANLLDAGEKFVDAVKEAASKFKGDLEESDFAKMLTSIYDNAKLPVKEDALNKIKELADENKDTEITSDMVSKNLIRDYVDSHIGEVDQKDILDTATKGLKEVLPDITKKKVIEAYLKEGEFKQPTKKDLEGGIVEAKKQLTSIAKLTEDIADLGNLKEVRQRSFSNERAKSEYEQKLYDEKNAKLKEISDRNKQIKEDYRKLEAERNRQQKIVSDLTDKKTKLENGVREKTSKNASKPDTPEIENLKEQVKKADEKLREAEAAQRKIIRDAQAKKDKIEELDANIKRAAADRDLIKTYKAKSDKQIDEEIAGKQKELKKVIKTNTSDERLQAQKLASEKQKAIKDIAEYKRKIAAGEFEDTKSKPVKLTTHDSEFIQLDRQRAKIQNEYREKQSKLKENSNSATYHILDVGRSLWVTYLIGAPKTLAKIAWMGFIKPTTDVARRLVFGNLFHLIEPNIYSAAKRGGESSSWRTIKRMGSAYFRQLGEAGVRRVYEKAELKYLDSQREFLQYQKSDNPSPKRLKSLKKKMDNRMFETLGNFVHQFVGGSSIADAYSSFVNRLNAIEVQFGDIQRDSYKQATEYNPDLSVGRNVLNTELGEFSYIAGFIGRSHSALKSFSARASFAAGFMARIEAKFEAGESIDHTTLLEIGHESYADWEAGKYQQSNLLSDSWNGIMNKQWTDNPQWHQYEKYLKVFMRGDIAVTRVPINILYEEAVEFTAGAFRAMHFAVKEYNKAFKQAIKEGTVDAIDEKQTEAFNTPEFRDRVKEIVKGMDGDQAAKITRNFQKGMVGLGLYTFAAFWAGIHFGIFPHMGQKKKKDEEKLKPDELNPGQVMIGKTKFGEITSGAIEHTPAAWPMFMGLGLAQQYNDDIQKGKTTKQAAQDAIWTHLQIVEGNIPFSKAFSPLDFLKKNLGQVKKTTDSYGLTDGVDTKGGLTDEEAKSPSIKYFLDKGDVLPNTNLREQNITNKEAGTKKAISTYSPELQDKYKKEHTNQLKIALGEKPDKKLVYVNTFKDETGELIHSVSFKYQSGSENKSDNDIAGTYKKVIVDKLTPEQRQKVLSLAQKTATRKAKKIVFGDVSDDDE